MKKIFAIAALLCFSSFALADDTGTHLVESKPIVYEELSKLGMQQRLRETAKEYEKYGSVARATNHDMAHPIDHEEYIKMNGFGVLWVTSHSQLKEEQPIKNARITMKNIGTIHLDSIYSFQTVENDKLVSTVLGSYRSDSIYLIPLFNETKGATLVADYSANRENFVIGSINNTFPPEMGTPIRLPSIIKYPDLNDINRMLEREFPIAKSLISTSEPPNRLPKEARLTSWIPQNGTPQTCVRDK